MNHRARGGLVSVGGVTWLVGVLVLELTYDSADDRLPLGFAVLALLAGVTVGWGCWCSASILDKRLGRVGMRSVAVCSGVLGLGFGLEGLPDMWLGFLAAYFVGLFLLPAAFLLFGLGVAGSEVFPKRGKWVPFAVAAVAIVTYGFHAVAGEVWDPPDWVWFVALGVGWVLTGLSIASTRTIASDAPGPLPNNAVPHEDRITGLWRP